MQVASLCWSTIFICNYAEILSSNRMKNKNEAAQHLKNDLEFKCQYYE